jgi:hypothetical protein
MPTSKTLTHTPRWYLVPARILALTFLMTLLCFAVSLLLGILAVLALAWVQGGHANMSTAYRHIALPAAMAAGAVALVSASVMEIRHYRQAKALAEIERTL